MPSNGPDCFRSIFPKMSDIDEGSKSYDYYIVSYELASELEIYEEIELYLKKMCYRNKKECFGKSDVMVLSRTISYNKNRNSPKSLIAARQFVLQMFILCADWFSRSFLITVLRGGILISERRIRLCVLGI